MEGQMPPKEDPPDGAAHHSLVVEPASDKGYPPSLPGLCWNTLTSEVPNCLTALYRSDCDVDTPSLVINFSTLAGKQDMKGVDKHAQERDHARYGMLSRPPDHGSP